MAAPSNLKLISFDTCPFVQRCAITLNEKKVEFEREIIDLNNKPQWFRDISPLGKVPVLQVGDTNLFESSVIMEYLDEVAQPTLLPEDPLERAEHKSWLVFSGELLNIQYQLSHSRREETFNRIEQDLHRRYKNIEARIDDKGFFSGEKIGLVDCAFGPFFMRAAILQYILGTEWFESFPKIDKWQENLLSRETFQNSVVDDFQEIYEESMAKKEGVLANFM